MIGRAIFGLTIGTLLVLLFGAFVAWNLRWFLQISDFRPETRFLIGFLYLFVLFVSVGVSGAFDCTKSIDEPSEEADNA